MAPPIWRQIQKKNFTSLSALAAFLELDSSCKEKIWSLPHFPLNVPYRLAQKMEKNSLEDPLLLQFIPLLLETLSHPSYTKEPVQDQQFCQTKKLLQKYQGRALLLVSSACAMHCRFCFRQNYPYETTPSFGHELEHLAKDPSLSEVILSGGDPLSLSNGSLQNLLRSLEEIPHLKRIRWHTRFPIGIPERIDEEFLHILQSSSKQSVFVLHINHPKELDEEVFFALRSLQSLQIPTLVQTVLLSRVNDDVDTLFSLYSTLINHAILPYYLHLLDPVQGAHHFDVAEEKGVALVTELETLLPGYGVPKLVREIPGEKSKTQIYKRS